MYIDLDTHPAAASGALDCNPGAMSASLSVRSGGIAPLIASDERAVLLSDNDLYVPPRFVHVLKNPAAALVLAAITYWFLPAKDGTPKVARRLKGDADNFWLTKTHGELCEETGLTAKQVRDALKFLCTRNLIAYEVHGAAARKATFVRLLCANGGNTIANRDAVDLSHIVVGHEVKVRARKVPSGRVSNPSKCPVGHFQNALQVTSNTEVTEAEVTKNLNSPTEIPACKKGPQAKLSLVDPEYATGKNNPEPPTPEPEHKPGKLHVLDLWIHLSGKYPINDGEQPIPNDKKHAGIVKNVVNTMHGDSLYSAGVVRHLLSTADAWNKFIWGVGCKIGKPVTCSPGSVHGLLVFADHWDVAVNLMPKDWLAQHGMIEKTTDKLSASPSAGGMAACDTPLPDASDKASDPPAPKELADALYAAFNGTVGKSAPVVPYVPTIAPQADVSVQTAPDTNDDAWQSAVFHAPVPVSQIQENLAAWIAEQAALKAIAKAQAVTLPDTTSKSNAKPKSKFKNA